MLHLDFGEVSVPFGRLAEGQGGSRWESRMRAQATRQGDLRWLHAEEHGKAGDEAGTVFRGLTERGRDVLRIQSLKEGKYFRLNS